MSLAGTQTANKGPGHLARSWDRWRDTKATLGTDTKSQRRDEQASQTWPRDQAVWRPPLTFKPGQESSCPVCGLSWSSFTISKRLLATRLFSRFHGNTVSGKEPKYYYNHPEDRTNSKRLSL